MKLPGSHRPQARLPRRGKAHHCHPVWLHCNGEAGGLCEDHTAGQGIPGAAMHAHFLRIWTVVQLRTSLLDLQVCESPGSHCSQAWLPRGGKAHHCHPVRLQCNGGAGGLCEDHRAGQGSLEQPRLYMEGVNLLSSQNLDYFSNTHQVRKSHWPLGVLSDRESCGCPLHRCLAPDLLPSVHAPRYAVLEPSDVHSQCQRQWLPGHLASCWQ